MSLPVIPLLAACIGLAENTMSGGLCDAPVVVRSSSKGTEQSFHALTRLCYPSLRAMAVTSTHMLSTSDLRSWSNYSEVQRGTYRGPRLSNWIRLNRSSTGTISLEME